ncbi:hypothetical protein [Actinomadura sp. DC4]|uniref:hypothetical protein n=1 Tax=Actinomadura sp. DC4 TaxID=3055069 RepID=UPI0025AF2E02|nr:hypothetical protein [Actinomadura sp. DC4]MDN3351647.1 hypothetical protein [Actinomadura sp. DC4]
MSTEPADWKEFQDRLADEDERGAVEVLAEMVAAARGAAVGPSREPLLRVRTTFAAGDGRPSVSWRVSAPRSDQAIDLRLPLSDLRRAAASGETVLRILAYALAAHYRGQPESRWHPHAFGRAHPAEPSAMLDRVRRYRLLLENETIDQHLGNDLDVLVYGKVGVGKTMMATWHASRHLEEDGGLVWLDLTDPYDCDESVAYGLLTMERWPRTLVVVDNVQANVSAARGVFDLVNQLRAEMRLGLVVLATGSPLTAQVEPPLSSTHLVLVPINNRRVVQAILHDAEDLPPGDRQCVEDLADGDCFLATKALELRQRLHRVPDMGELVDYVAESIGVDRVSSGARRTLYTLACLSLFEIEMPRRQSVSNGLEGLEELRSAELVHLNDESYTIGPRSQAKLLVRHIKRSWQERQALPSPDRVVYEHLQRSGAAQIKATLNRLELLPFGHEGPFDPKQLASAWSALGFLGDSLAGRVLDDPGWGDEVASAAFAGIALSYLGKADAWRECANFVRGRWSYDTSGDLPTWVGEPSADLDSFVRIHDLMAAESAAINGGAPSATAQSLAPETACQGWMLGVLLSFEATAIDRDPPRVDRLRHIAQQAIEAGTFRSAQMPWITAQMILGLCLAGYDETDHAIQQACRWLCQDKRLGGAYESGWHNGVAGDASDAMSTALCLSALLHAGYPQPAKVRTSYERLCLAQDSMVTNNQETELSLIVEARIRTGDEWEDLKPAIIHLLGWATRADRRGPELRATRPGEPLSASAKAPFIAVQLWIIIWTTVNRELRRMLHELWGMEDLLPPPRPVNTGRPAADRSREPAVPLRAIEADVNRAITRLRREIEEHINTRASMIDDLLPSVQATFQRRLDLWNSRGQTLDAIEHELAHGGVSGMLVSKLNTLGQEIIRSGWRRIPDPNARGEP